MYPLPIPISGPRSRRRSRSSCSATQINQIPIFTNDRFIVVFFESLIGFICYWYIVARTQKNNTQPNKLFLKMKRKKTKKVKKNITTIHAIYLCLLTLRTINLIKLFKSHSPCVKEILMPDLDYIKLGRSMVNRAVVWCGSCSP